MHRDKESEPIPVPDQSGLPHHGDETELDSRSVTRNAELLEDGKEGDAQPRSKQMAGTATEQQTQQDARQETYLGLTDRPVVAPREGMQEVSTAPVPAFQEQQRGSLVASAASSVAGAKRGHGGRRRTFPIRLYTMLSDVERMGLADIVSWQPHGRCFVVHKSKEFVEQILGSYFQQTKWSSFQRQLNLYSFGRITSGPDRNAYYHPNFLRGQPGLCHTIVRTKVKGTKVRVPNDAKSEPNFYAQPPLDPSSERRHQRGLAGHDRWTAQSMPASLQTLPSAGGIVGMLPALNSSIAATAAASNSAMIQALAAVGPPILYAVYPYALAAQAVAVNPSEAAPVPSGSVGSMAVSSQNLDLAAQLNSMPSFTMPASFSPPEVGSTSTSTGGDTDDSKQSASSTTEDNTSSDSLPKVPPTNPMLRSGSSGEVASRTSRTSSNGSSGGSSNISDGAKTIQNMLETMGAEGGDHDSKSPPSSNGDEQEWGKFLNRYFD